MLSTLMNYFRGYVGNDERGQGLVEYALIIAIVAVLIVGSLIALRGGIEGVFTDIIDAF